MRWSGWLFDNLGLKLFALLLAVLLYFHVLTDRPSEQTLYFPVTVEGLPDSLALASSVPTEVGVRLRGTGKQLIRLGLTKPPVRLSLAGVSPGMYQRALGPADVPLSGMSDVTVLEVKDPSEVRLEVTRRAGRFVPVLVPIVGEPARGLIVAGPIEVRPRVVRVSGPATWVARQETLRTEPVSIAGRRELVIDTVTVGVADGSVRLVEPRSATVSVRIVPAPVERVVRGVPIRWRNLNNGLTARIQPQATSVTVRGVRDALDAMRAETIDAFVDLAGLGPGQYNLRVQFDPTETFGVTTSEPAVVQVTIK